MEKVLGLGGVFFRAKDPKVLGAWYQDHLGVDPICGPWMAEGGATVIAPFPADTDYFDRPEQAWMINFRVADLDAMVAQLKSAGVSVRKDPSWDSEIGRFARIHDPEGNPIELWEPITPA